MRSTVCRARPVRTPLTRDARVYPVRRGRGGRGESKGRGGGGGGRGGEGGAQTFGRFAPPLSTALENWP